MDSKFKIVVLVTLVLYVLSPADLVPGPIDDIILCIVYALVNNKKSLEG